MAHKFSTSYIEDSLSLFRYYKKLSESSMEQLSDEQLFTALDEEMNSIAIIVKHLKGSSWKTLSVPRNKSAEFTSRVLAGEASQR